MSTCHILQVTLHIMSCFHGNNIPTGVASSSHSYPSNSTLHGGPGPQGRHKNSSGTKCPWANSGSSEGTHLKVENGECHWEKEGTCDDTLRSSLKSPFNNERDI